MSFKYSLFLASLLTAASCAPSSPNPQYQAVQFFKTQDSINDCGDSTFINQSSGASPTVADCLQIAANIAGGGTWTVALIEQHQLVQYGSCAFGVQAPFEVGIVDYRVGNQDIIDLINSSVDMYGGAGVIGSEGTMPCQCDVDPGGTIPVTWGIYHT